MFNIIGKSKLWYSISGIFIILGLTALVSWGLNFSIDYTGGSLLELNFKDSRPTIADVTTAAQQAGLSQVTIQPTGETGDIIRTETLTEERHQEILTSLRESLPEFTEDRFESIGPIIGQELTRKSIWSLLIVMLAIILYIAYAFRKVSEPVASWKYGVAATIALLHDLIIIVGLYAIIGHFVGWQVDSLFITALLTILGFSVHDTIVTFDRARELLKTESHAAENFEETINTSVKKTITRSINTSFTTFLVLFAIFVFGGESIRHFIGTLGLGIIIGTYSSIFIASPILVLWHKMSKSH